MNIKELILAIRERRGWSYDILAEKLRARKVKCDQRTVWAWGHDQVPRENTRRFLRPALEQLLKYGR